MKARRLNNKVQVYISTTNTKQDQVKLLKSLFCRSYFDVHTISIPNPSQKVNSINSYRFMEVIKYAYKNNPSKYILYLKDNSITTTNSESIIDIITYAMKQNNWDMLYLCRWLDRCDLYNKIKDKPTQIPYTNAYLSRTISPNGLQAILFSPIGIKRVLGHSSLRNGKMISPLGSFTNELRQNIEKGGLYAITTLPNLFSYNVLDANSISDLAKMSGCRRPERRVGELPTKTISPMLLFFVIIVIIIMILWALYYLGAKPSNSEKKTALSH